MTIAYKLLFYPLTVRHIACLQILLTTVEPRFNEVNGDRPNVFVIEGTLYRNPQYNEFEGKRPKCSLYRGHS